MIIDQTPVDLFDEGQLGLLRDAIGSEELLAMLSDLPAAAEEAIQSIAAAVRTGDFLQARRAAHVLKGCASSFGAARLAAIAAEVELDLPTIGAIEQRLPALTECLELTAAALDGAASGSKP